MWRDIVVTNSCSCVVAAQRSFAAPATNDGQSSGGRAITGPVEDALRSAAEREVEDREDFDRDVERAEEMKCGRVNTRPGKCGQDHFRSRAEKKSEIVAAMSPALTARFELIRGGRTFVVRRSRRKLTR
jgi:hypothetical protein